MQYAFLNVLDIFGDLDSDSEEILAQCNGSVKVDLNNGTGRYTILPKNPIQAVMSVGFVW